MYAEAACDDSRAACTIGQSATNPRSTSGRVEVRISSGKTRGSTPRVSAIFSATAGMQAIPPFDEHAELGERGNRHIDRLQIAGLVEAFERATFECVEALLVDRVEAGEAILRAVDQRDIEHEGFDQLVLD